MAGVERIPPAVSYRGAFSLRGQNSGDVNETACDVHYADYLEYVIEKEGGIEPSSQKLFVTPMFKCQVRLIGNASVRSVTNTTLC